MDVRALLCFWAIKPTSIDTGGHNIAIMAQSVFHGDGSHGTTTGRSIKRWGNPYEAVELWIDIDRGIKNGLDNRDFTTVEIYVEAMIGSYGYNWERWKALPHFISKQLLTICYNVLQEGDTDETS